MTFGSGLVYKYFGFVKVKGDWKLKSISNRHYLMMYNILVQSRNLSRIENYLVLPCKSGSILSGASKASQFLMYLRHRLKTRHLD